jgi:cysteinyl-tRNA synthetase
MKLHNTKTRKKEEVKPLKEGQLTLYTCGPTVYDFAHIGNFRTYVFEDLLKRTLKYAGFSVNHVMNITDIDDKTIAGALREQKTVEEYTAPFNKAFFDDLDTLNIERADHYPHATAYIT